MRSSPLRSVPVRARIRLGATYSVGGRIQPDLTGCWFPAIGVLGFSHVGVCCSDLDRSTRFYADVLGFRELFTVELGAEVAATMEIDGRFSRRRVG
jgi:Glyoxalase/Bleomycin resistance protein/Dioxygenase superfamily